MAKTERTYWLQLDSIHYDVHNVTVRATSVAHANILAARELRRQGFDNTVWSLRHIEIITNRKEEAFA